MLYTHICNVDVTVYHRGYHGDLNETFFVGTPKEQAKKLVTNTPLSAPDKHFAIDHSANETGETLTP